MNLDEAKAALQDFLDNHRKSTIALSAEYDNSLIVENPWGDSSVVIVIPQNPEALFDALNKLLLPEQFSGLWHKDTKDFEIIYTAFPLAGNQAAMKDRKFTFTFRGTNYICEFSQSSNRLLTIAEHIRPVGPSPTDHRNMQSFSYYVHAEKGERGAIKIADMRPTSFWIKNLKWDDETVVALCRHLNFYMSYYDAMSPSIAMHARKEEVREPRERYITGAFPKTIIAADLNSNLMHFWAGSRTGDFFRRFLYCYQILEFASFYFVEDNVKRAIRMALSTPHIQDEMDSVVIDIIDCVSESRVWEGNKMEALLRDVVKSDLIWREIEKNKEYFCSTIEFDGGFVLKPLIFEKITREAFNHDWHDKFNRTIRSIRNALSHGKEQSMSSVIAPTPTNFANIQPWAALISVAAGEVVVYYSAAM